MRSAAQTATDGASRAVVAEVEARSRGQSSPWVTIEDVAKVHHIDSQAAKQAVAEMYPTAMPCIGVAVGVKMRRPFPPSISGRRTHMASRQASNASMEQRLAAVERVLEVRAHDKGLSVDGTMEWQEENLLAENGAKVVARAWTDPAFRQRLLADGKAAIAEFGIDLPAIQRQVYVLENTPAVHNVIVCTLCSCTATTLIGPPPNWYEDLEYRARVVREARTVLQEMGCPVAPETEIRVWDTTADTRFMVLPMQPPETVGWPEDRLASIVTRDSLIGVAQLSVEGG